MSNAYFWLLDHLFAACIVVGVLVACGFVALAILLTVEEEE